MYGDDALVRQYGRALVEDWEALLEDRIFALNNRSQEIDLSGHLQHKLRSRSAPM